MQVLRKGAQPCVSAESADRLSPASQHSLPQCNLSPGLQKEQIQHSSRWKAITLLRGPVTQGKHPNSGSDSHFWQLLLPVKGTAVALADRVITVPAPATGTNHRAGGIIPTAGRQKAVGHHLLFRAWLCPRLKQTLIIFYRLEKGMAKLNSSCIFPKQHILEQSVKDTLTYTYQEDSQGSSILGPQHHVLLIAVGCYCAHPFSCWGRDSLTPLTGTAQ